MLDIEEYQRLRIKEPGSPDDDNKKHGASECGGEKPTIVDLLYYPGAGEIEFELPRREVDSSHYVDPFD